MFFKFFHKKKNERRISSFLEIGFHGDKYLLAFANNLIKNSTYFIETGTNVASTLAYVARTFPSVQCISCEPDRATFNEAVKNTAELPNVVIYNMLSQDFVNYLRLQHKNALNGKCIFWLDAHGYGFQWPLKDELRFITSNFTAAYILIDDFKVPGMDCFKYDTYQDQVCSLDFIKDSLDPRHRYHVYYPNYTENTSKYHPLVGWGLIEFGHDDKFDSPQILCSKVKGPLNV